MKDEIKEILDNLRFSYEQNKKLYEKYNQDVMRYIIHLKEAELLLDYITDLQDTLMDKQECINAYDEIIKHRDKEITDLQKRMLEILKGDEKNGEME